MVQHRLCQNFKNMFPRVQGRIGILKDHLQLRADPAHFFFIERKQIPSFIQDPALRWYFQPYKLTPDGGFPAAGFPHKAQGLPFHDSKGNIIHCMDVSGGMCDNTSLNGIILLQVVDLNQRFLFFIHSGQPPCISVFVTTGRPPTQSCSFIKAQFAGCSVSFIKV